VIPTQQADHIACQLLKFEQQLKAYEKLHTGELTELWQTLNDCKQALAAIVSASEFPSPEESNDSETGSSLASVTPTSST
jgi:hypothetical protein